VSPSTKADHSITVARLPSATMEQQISSGMNPSHLIGLGTPKGGAGRLERLEWSVEALVQRNNAWDTKLHEITAALALQTAMLTELKKIHESQASTRTGGHHQEQHHVHRPPGAEVMVSGHDAARKTEQQSGEDAGDKSMKGLRIAQAMQKRMLSNPTAVDEPSGFAFLIGSLRGRKDGVGGSLELGNSPMFELCAFLILFAYGIFLLITVDYSTQEVADREDLLFIVDCCFILLFTAEVNRPRSGPSAGHPPKRQASAASAEATAPWGTPYTIGDFFGTMSKTLFSLFQILTLESWCMGIVRPVGYHAPWTLCIIIPYIVFVTVAVMNVITGIFVDHIMEASKADGEQMLKAREAEVTTQLSELRRFFLQGDSDGDGCLTLEEFEGLLSAPTVQSFFLKIGLDTHEAVALFHTVDTDDSGSVDVDEFLFGVMRVRGGVKALDMLSLTYDLHRLGSNVDEIFNAVSKMQADKGAFK